jgi:hypothetical protein
MHDPSIVNQISALSVGWVKIFYGDNKSKIEAVNADMEKIEWSWDILVLVSDDMIPKYRGYDDVIRSNMPPSTDGIVWIHDGLQGYNLNTLTIMGRTMYNSFGYIYHPSYKSLWCDTEFTDLCKGPLASKCVFVNQPLIRHEHPGAGYSNKQDALYQKNNKFWSSDLSNYVSRKNYQYDWSILIPTLVERTNTFNRLMTSLREKHQRICPNLKIEFCVALDNRQKSIGSKRQDLLDQAKGKYLSFIDDDDDVTDAYFEDAVACIQNGFQVSRLRGQMSQFTFTHSIENTLNSPMARDQEFLRPPNHLNVMLSDAAKLVRFKNAKRGEDLDWTVRLAMTGILTKEYQADHSRIHYIYNLGPRVVHQSILEKQKTISYVDMLKQVWVPMEDPVTVQPLNNGLKLTAKGFVSK